MNQSQENKDDFTEIKIDEIEDDRCIICLEDESEGTLKSNLTNSLFSRQEENNHPRSRCSCNYYYHQHCANEYLTHLKTNHKPFQCFICRRNLGDLSNYLIYPIDHNDNPSCWIPRHKWENFNVLFWIISIGIVIIQWIDYHDDHKKIDGNPIYLATVIIHPPLILFAFVIIVNVHRIMAYRYSNIIPIPSNIVTKVLYFNDINYQENDYISTTELVRILLIDFWILMVDIGALMATKDISKYKDASIIALVGAIPTIVIYLPILFTK